MRARPVNPFGFSADAPTSRSQDDWPACACRLSRHPCTRTAARPVERGASARLRLAPPSPATTERPVAIVASRIPSPSSATVGLPRRVGVAWTAAPRPNAATPTSSRWWLSALRLPQRREGDLPCGCALLNPPSRSRRVSASRAASAPGVSTPSTKFGAACQERWSGRCSRLFSCRHAPRRCSPGVVTTLPPRSRGRHRASLSRRIASPGAAKHGAVRPSGRVTGSETDRCLGKGRERNVAAAAQRAA